MLIGLVFLFGPWVVVPKYTDTTASQIVITSGWYCFVLLNAFYGGALTMFFVGEITLPFNNIRLEQSISKLLYKSRYFVLLQTEKSFNLIRTGS